MILNFLRWILGYASFEIIGGYPEKLINLAVKNNINFWGLKRIGADFKAQIKATDYKRLRPLAKISNSKVKICKKYGLPFFIFKHRKRWGTVLGILVFFIVLYIFSLYVWSIKIVGNNALCKEEIIGVLDSAGLSVGALKSRIVPSEIEEYTMSHMDKISWMSVNIKGCTVSVEIKEKVEKPEISKPGGFCNIVAIQDGQIDRLETYQGTPMVASGDVVTKGQLLISGVTEDADLKSKFLGADGKVFAKTKEKITERIPLYCVKAEDTGKVIKKIRIKFFGMELPLWGWYKGNDSFRKEIFLGSCNIFGVDLPIKIYKEFLYEQAISDYKLDLDEARAKAEENIKEKEESLFKDASILEKDVKETVTDDEYTLEIIYSCIKDIAKQESISFE